MLTTFSRTTYTVATTTCDEHGLFDCGALTCLTRTTSIEELPVQFALEVAGEFRALCAASLR